MARSRARQRPRVWLKFAKKGTGIRSLHYPEALDVALCYGWIDGQLRRLDDTYHLQRFTPRRARSTWSKINRENVAALIDAGRMKTAGMAEIERAKADGRWDAAYDSPALATVPDDLQEALKQTPRHSSSLRRWAARAVTRSCTGSRTQSGPRPARAGLPRSSRCSNAAKPSDSCGTGSRTPRIRGNNGDVPDGPAGAHGESCRHGASEPRGGQDV